MSESQAAQIQGAGQDYLSASQFYHTPAAYFLEPRSQRSLILQLEEEDNSLNTLQESISQRIQELDQEAATLQRMKEDYDTVKARV
ncbi:hypothetical protein BLNAU_8797 [Blattamonas nauphoetae]|uniref:Uncharacterized protein n=1 Tax=Blattamonas nauphoetae TaxID=2049346 RepID=A0ABQ9XXQ1_9EUKA|nr:hypothetical protein BLNAU_8797 [Blattamonas nauphoetae]